MVDLVLFVIESGAVVAPGPFLATAAMFAPLLAAVGHPMADAAISGEITGTVAIPGPDGTWAPNASSTRTQVIDLDLVWLHGEALDEPGLTLPHPGVSSRNFVLYPLNDIAPTLTIPGVGTIRDLLPRVGDEGICVVQ